jgi:hypothetical protein
MGLTYCYVKGCRAADLGGWLLPDGHEMMTIRQMALTLADQKRAGTLQKSEFRRDPYRTNGLFFVVCCADHGLEYDDGHLRLCGACGRYVQGQSPPGEARRTVCSDCKNGSVQLARPAYIGVSVGRGDISWDVVDGLPMETTAFFSTAYNLSWNRVSGVKWGLLSQPRNFAEVRLWRDPDRPPTFAILPIPHVKDARHLSKNVRGNEIGFQQSRTPTSSPLSGFRWPHADENDELDEPPFGHSYEMLLVHRKRRGIGKMLSTPRIALHGYFDRDGLSRWRANGGGPLPQSDFGDDGPELA